MNQIIKYLTRCAVSYINTPGEKEVVETMSWDNSNFPYTCGSVAWQEGYASFPMFVKHLN